MFKNRSTQLERIDTGDYTLEEYAVFLREIAFINKYLGDARALKKTLFREIERSGRREFSMLDVGSGSGELLRTTADFARRTGLKTKLTGIDLNAASAGMTRSMSRDYAEITSARGDAFALPFGDGAFDYAISSLFFHHFTDEQIPLILKEMSRVSRRGVFVVDLHRHRAAYYLYKLFCSAFRISPLVKEDGSLSILKGFRPDEMMSWGGGGVCRVAPFRLVFSMPAKPDARRI